MKLSILICTIIGRENYLERLMNILNKQKNDEIEILIECDDKKISIGEKRNKLMEKAKGDYICYVDDDDIVSEDYVVRILEALKSNPDAVGFTAVITIDGNNPKLVYSSNSNSWSKKNDVFLRPIQHLNPVKRNLALQCRFSHISQREDEIYSNKLSDFIKTEVVLENPPVYFYEYTSRK